MLKAFHYCNNCGKTGHAFHQCKYPITSIGVIVYRKEKPVQGTNAIVQGTNSVVQGTNSVVQGTENIAVDASAIDASAIDASGAIDASAVDTTAVTEEKDNLKFLMISRKDSLGFVEFIRGKYQIYNKMYLRSIIDGMTNGEKKRLLSDDFDTLLKSLWGTDMNVNNYRNEELISRDKFLKLKEGIKIDNDDFYSLKTLIEESTTSWETSEWGFPKGRRNYQEKELVCALREFQEETGYKKNLVKIIQNLLPLEEIFTGSNFKSYKHCYYLGCMETFEEPSEHFQESEVGQIGWFSYKEALKIIRPYNVEKADILTKAYKIVTTYTII
jgi:8-oxo-dGTP pyrophosphatase MutT (NUDIX family)